MGYGIVIRRLRGNLSLEKFSKIVDISRSHLERVEKEYSNQHKEKLRIPIDTLKQICDRTNYPFRKFLEEAGYLTPLSPQVNLLLENLNNLNEAQINDIINLIKNYKTENILSDSNTKIHININNNNGLIHIDGKNSNN